jgi:membrane protease YdiL (CAAX protease family)
VVVAHVMMAVVVIAPAWLAWRRYQVLRSGKVAPARRRVLLWQSIVLKCVLLPPLLVVWTAAGFDPVSWWGTDRGRWVGGLLALLAGIGALAFAVRTQSADRDHMAKAVEHIAALLPRTREERVVFAVAAVTAGITEEILYRAFLVTYLDWLLPAGWTVAAVVGGVVFGLTHVYQGLRGVIPVSLVGITFGLLYPTVGLVTLMVVHAVIDARVLLLPADLVPDST